VIAANDVVPLDGEPDLDSELERLAVEASALVPEAVSALLRDVDASGPTVAVLVARRPPLLVSHDGGLTWAERGSGLPLGTAIAFGPTPDDLLYAARNRLYVSRNGGTFWRSLGVELPEIRGVAWG